MNERSFSMRATVMHGADDVRVETVPDARLVEPTDALVVVTRACICGSDLGHTSRWQPSETGVGWGTSSSASSRPSARGPNGQAGRCGRRSIRLVGRHLRLLPGGAPHFLPARRVVGRRRHSTAGRARRCASRRRTARSSCFPVGRDDALMPSLLTLSDVMGTGHHAALAAKVGPGKPWPSSATARSGSAA